MKKQITFFFISLLTLIIGSSVWCENLTGQEIMQLVENSNSSKTSHQKTTMKLIDKKGRERVREVISYSKDYGNINKHVMIFQKPSDVKGVGYLSFSYDEISKEEDTWLYLPALGRTRRISGSSKNDNFMGTDFTYDDMGEHKIEEDNHTLLREETIDGYKCWVVESIPKEKNYMYSKRVSWIRQDILIGIKVEFYDRQKKLMKQLIASDAQQISNIWTVKKLEMHNVQTNHRTVLLLDDIEFNIDVTDSYFTVASLERGHIR